MSLNDCVTETATTYGVDQLSDAQLLSLLLNRDQSRRANTLLGAAGGMGCLLQLGPAELHGLGLTRKEVLRMGAIPELFRRINRGLPELPQITSPKVAGAYLIPRCTGMTEERFGLLALNAKGVLLAERILSQGTASGTLISPREFFREALRYGATTALAWHNHPSGEELDTPEVHIHTGHAVECERLSKLGPQFCDARLHRLQVRFQPRQLFHLGFDLEAQHFRHTPLLARFLALLEGLALPCERTAMAEPAFRLALWQRTRLQVNRREGRTLFKSGVVRRFEGEFEDFELAQILATDEDSKRARNTGKAHLGLDLIKVVVRPARFGVAPEGGSTGCFDLQQHLPILQREPSIGMRTERQRGMNAFPLLVPRFTDLAREKGSNDLDNLVLQDAPREHAACGGWVKRERALFASQDVAKTEANLARSQIGIASGKDTTTLQTTQEGRRIAQP